MEPLTIISVLSGIASVFGYSIRDLLGTKSAEKKNLAMGMARFLSVFEQEEDPLVGIWSLNCWDYKYESHSHFYVSGNLAVLYRDPHSKRWKGTIFLRYQRRLSSRGILKADGWIARHLGDCIDGAYDIEIQEISNNNYCGTSTQTYRNPKRGIIDTGEFRNVQLSKDGKLVGEFFNTNTQGTAKVIFHQRKRWREFVPGTLL